MDLALAIYEIRPGSRYRLNKSAPPDQVILEWRGPGDEPTQQELEDAWVIVSARIAAEEAAEAEEATNKTEAKTRFLISQLADKTPEEIYTLMQTRMDNWTTLGDARTDLREWLPLMAALIAWTVARE